MPTPIRRRAALVWLSVCAITAAMGAASAAPLVTIETIGEEVVGRLDSIDSRDGVRLIEGESPRLASSDVLKIVFEEARRSPSGVVAVGELELVDGSRFNYVDVAFDGEEVRFALRGGVRVATPVTNIASWKTGSDDTLDSASTRGASDVLVVKRRDGGYAPVEGVVVELSSKGVRFALEADDGAEPVEAPWSRIGGIRFYRTDKRQANEHLAIVTLIDGGRVAAEEVRYADGRVRWSQGEAPVEAVASLDLSGGRVIPVKELKLLADEYVPYFQEEGAKTSGYAFDKSLLGGPLNLRYPDRRASGAWPAVSVKREFARGVALRSHSELRLELPEGAQRVRGVVGLDPDAALAGSAVVRIVADDKTLWSGAIDGASAPVTIDEPLAAAKTLTLQVDYGDNLDAGDFVNFCELRVIR
jgi:hypothetical protein